ncbi:hypothetical protein CC1G_09959 [Coprinopsis cinerea okayama7|uniref:Uncharacterized protein n=1 Tax=Coprinopsis cinerea (strain Okayama-7 / 130 / ATCC MYA-4618 / FGSC 9003) TaxID=240176 RepID=A8PGS2_COPC7|nr:hypothetical protein CC1G_09959 [Coprinopsis cinerea okayama7\|eukprot:XP_001841267.2 hypothetical protein CC1G_09959 [Coprinopsis cinerea okayama7\
MDVCFVWNFDDLGTTRGASDQNLIHLILTLVLLYDLDISPTILMTVDLAYGFPIRRTLHTHSLLALSLPADSNQSVMTTTVTTGKSLPTIPTSFLHPSLNLSKTTSRHALKRKCKHAPTSTATPDDPPPELLSGKSTRRKPALFRSSTSDEDIRTMLARIDAAIAITPASPLQTEEYGPIGEYDHPGSGSNPSPSPRSKWVVGGGSGSGGSSSKSSIRTGSIDGATDPLRGRKPTKRPSLNRDRFESESELFPLPPSPKSKTKARSGGKEDLKPGGPDDSRDDHDEGGGESPVQAEEVPHWTAVLESTISTPISTPRPHLNERGSEKRLSFPLSSGPGTDPDTSCNSSAPESDALIYETTRPPATTGSYLLETRSTPTDVPESVETGTGDEDAYADASSENEPVPSRWNHSEADIEGYSSTNVEEIFRSIFTRPRI